MFLENIIPPIPSEIIMPLGGFFVYQQKLNFYILVFWGLLGTILGSLLGAMFGFFFCEILLGHGISLDAKVYGIDHFPVHTDWIDYIYAMISSLVIIGIAVFFPARRAASRSSSPIS